MRFIAVATTIFINAQWQVAIRLDPLTEDENMRRAIHGLQCHPVGVTRNHGALVIDIGYFVRNYEHIGAIFAPMPRLLPLPRVHDLRRFNFLITRIINGAAHIGFQLTPNQIAIGMPEYRSMRLLLQMEQIHVLPQTAMVALCGFFQPDQMRIQLLFV